MEEKKQSSFFRFEDLRIYNKAIEYNKWVAKTLKSKDLSTVEERLVSEFCKVSVAIATSIAEGAYHNKKEFELYLKDAKANVRECIIFSTLAKELSIFHPSDEEYSRECLMEITRMLGALIISLSRKTSKRDSNHTDNKPESVEEETIATEDTYDFNLEF